MNICQGSEDVAFGFYDRMRRFKGRRERLGCDDRIGAGLVVDNAQSSRGDSRSKDLYK